jgi:hypothetical protein
MLTGQRTVLLVSVIVIYTTVHALILYSSVSNGIPNVFLNVPKLRAYTRVLNSKTQLLSGVGEIFASEDSRKVNHVVVCEAEDLFRAIITLDSTALQTRQSALPVFVSIFGWNEKASQIGESQHGVFQEMSAHAAQALAFFCRGHPSSPALHSLLIWLSHFRSLFTEPCHYCKRILTPSPLSGSAVGPLPPTYRDLETGIAAHPSCFIVQKAPSLAQ